MKVIKRILNRIKTDKLTNSCKMTCLSNKFKNRLFQISIILILGKICFTGFLYAGTSAGTIITNKASFSYSDFAATFTNYAEITNIRTVTNLSMVMIIPSRTTNINEGTNVIFTHKLTNYGNESNTIHLSYNSLIGLSINVYWDTNNNQIIDGSEELATNDIRLPPNYSIPIIVQVQVPVLGFSSIIVDTITISGTNKSVTNLNILGVNNYITILPENNIVRYISANDGIHTAVKLNGTEKLGDNNVTLDVKFGYMPLSGNVIMYYDINQTPDGSNPANSSDRSVSMVKKNNNWTGVIPGDDPGIVDNVKVNIVFESDGNVIYRTTSPSKDAFIYIVRSYNFKKIGNLLNSICYPLDPSKPKPTLMFKLAKPGDVKIDIFDIKGDKIKTLVDEYRGAGIQSPVYWDGKNNSGEISGIGVYFIKLQYDDIKEIFKVLVIKK